MVKTHFEFHKNPVMINKETVLINPILNVKCEYQLEISLETMTMA